jgi:hypothetical protein
MKIDFDTYCEKHGPDILESIKDEILNLNVPKRVHNQLLMVIENYEFEIYEEHYYQALSEHEDLMYQEHKESKLFN